MKKHSLAFLLLAFSFLSVFFSCTKINEATELGGDLIPPIDNVNTFDSTFDVLSSTSFLTDTTKLLFSDNVALGALNDPDFGRTEADVYFNLSSSSYGSYPFIINRNYANNPDSLKIDSVVLTLAYTGNYGDSNSFQTVKVFEIAQTSGFNDTTLYKFDNNLQPDFQTTGSELGSKTFYIKDLNDSIPFIRKKDTSKTANLLHINLDPQLGRRIAGFDTVAGSSNSGLRNDSIFKTLFRGLAIKSNQAVDNGGLAYFNLTDANTRMTIYFRAIKNGVPDTSSVSFYHATNGQANLIDRHPSGPYLANATNGSGSDAEIYLQSSPGSYAGLKIPGLDNLGNKVVHRAELIVTRIPSILDNIFTPPGRLILDRKDSIANLLQNDLVPSIDGNLSFSTFGGVLLGDNTYRFNITRHVQGILTRQEPNDSLRIYAPLRTTLYASNLKFGISVPVLSRIADGRVVLTGGSYTANPANRLRLRIIYSKL